ncbi:MAG: hypothetical protein B5M53_09630 [Candidatus Cloacimonas sp. 4484_209]|nr:MAG: hypothetical protein B5M53_09630 [Candidatus Cloacimonas sp. 4484_209]
MTFYNWIITAIIFALLLNLLNNLKLIKPLRKGRKKLKNPPLVSVLVPARDESDNIEKCITSLANQDYPNYELIVLDDNSSDDTLIKLEKLKEKFPKLQYISGKSLPVGWTGKNFSCYTLSQYAKGQWLLFTDADTVHRKQSISRAVSSAIRYKAMLLSVIPDITIETIAEHIFVPIIYFGLLTFLPLRLVNSSRFSKVVIALGPFMLINADFYRKIGGHEKIKGEIVDDFRLAQEVKKNGGKQLFMNGKETVRVRFYKNFAAFWNGFSKNSFGAFDNSPLVFLPFIAVCICTYLIPYIAFTHEIINSKLELLVFFQVILITLHSIFILFKFRINRFHIILNPISIALWILVALNSMRLTLLDRTLVWKDRIYSLKKSSRF